MNKQFRNFAGCLAKVPKPNKVTKTILSPRLLRLRCGRPKLVRSIIRETRVTRNHLTPELSLHLITPECRLYHTDDEVLTGVLLDSIYWGFYSACMQGIARFILDNPNLFEGKSVLDLCGGCGAASLAALKCNAKYALMNEDLESCACAANLNAVLNNQPMSRFIVYPHSLVGYPIKEDIVLIGDSLHIKSAMQGLSRWLKSLHKDKCIYLAEAYRSDDFLTQYIQDHEQSFQKQCVYDLPQHIFDDTGYDRVTIWKY